MHLAINSMLLESYENQQRKCRDNFFRAAFSKYFEHNDQTPSWVKKPFE